MEELRKRLFFVFGAILVYRIGTYIPVPGINPAALASFFEQQSGTIIDMFNMFSGGALERFSILALGIMPYISASIIMQLMSATMPALKEIKKQGESGRKKITQYTRFGTLGLSTLQAGGVAVALQSQGIALYSGSGFVFSTIVTLVTGTMFLMWLGEQISEKGIGNGISIIIFISIVSGLPTAVGGTLELASTGELNSALVVMILVLAIAVTAFVVFIERGQRKITVNYARRQQGRKMVQAQSSYLPLKLNMAGVIPPIFASSIILFPSTLGQWAGSADSMSWLKDISSTLAPGQPLYVTFYAAAIIFFCFFYTALVYDSRETSDNLKKSGASIPGVRPGEQTSRYIDNVLTRLTAVGAIYITLVCLLPEFLIIGLNVPFYFGGTSLLIIVVVIMDFIGQLQSHMMNYQYGSLMKKSNLQGYKR
ncbi:MAG: preprotein translocase subunit SecY [Gammaproteobacteria bacterium]|tara:strand:- start:501 stop:1775 length:1275 start_codon:yes stop_codon:yes gene_type:complete